MKDRGNRGLISSELLIPESDEARSSSEAFREEILDGLMRPEKCIPCKLFYDDHGSNLFEQICAQAEYYPTRIELGIMRRHAKEMATVIGPNSLIVEYGAGSGLKTRLLLDQMSGAAAYVPIDISSSQLTATARALADAYPDIPIRPVFADYTRPLKLPTSLGRMTAVAAYFPGSTIGNFEREDAIRFLRQIRATCGGRSGLLIGVDLVKDPNILHAAYNDSAGITAQFNLNILRRLNRELGSDFRLEAFRHYAFFNPKKSKIEMHLVSLRGPDNQAWFGGNNRDRGERKHSYGKLPQIHVGFLREASRGSWIQAGEGLDRFETMVQRSVFFRCGMRMGHIAVLVFGQ